MSSVFILQIKMIRVGWMDEISSCSVPHCISNISCQGYLERKMHYIS